VDESEHLAGAGRNLSGLGPWKRGLELRLIEIPVIGKVHRAKVRPANGNDALSEKEAVGITGLTGVYSPETRLRWHANYLKR
jgi:hypothetical protein